MIKHSIRIIIVFILVVTCFKVSGVPAYPNKVKVTIENGETVEIVIKGDEYFKYAISEEGYLLSPRNDSWYYLKKNSDLEYAVSNIQLKKSVSKSFEDSLVKINSSKPYFSRINFVNRERRQVADNEVCHALVVLMEYTNKSFIKSKLHISDLFNQIGYTEDNAKGSVRDYYQYASYGTFDLISDIYGPYTTKFSMDFYGDNAINGNDSHAIELVLEAIDNLPEDLDLSLYDNNNDGSVDNIHIIFAGYGEESGAPSSTIWSHEYPHSLPVMKNGYSFAGYSCTPELRSNMGSGISRIGVICHELGHAFGANDYYDVDYSLYGSYEGTGDWDIMASGSWNDNGISPANFNPYTKIEDFGWIKPITPEDCGTISLPSYNFTPTVLRLPTTNPNDYYLVEYRMGQYFDDALPGEGVIIYHVHPYIESRRITNTINSTHPQCFYPVCASSEKSPFDTSDYGDINSAGCPFPGVSNNIGFSASSKPCAFMWNGATPDFSIDNISIYDDRAQFDLLIDSKQSNVDPIESIVYHESFENGLGGFFIESIVGDADWQIYPTNSLSTLNDVPKPFEGKRALMLYDGNKSVISSRSLLASEEIILSSDSIYEISLRMMTKEPKSTGYHELLLSIWNQDTYKWEKVYSNCESITEWTEIKVELPKAISSFYYQLEGEILNGGIFIDDVRISSLGEANTERLDIGERSIIIINNPFSIVANITTTVKIYDLSGNIIENYIMAPSTTITPQLPKGIYVVCSDKGERYKVVI